MDIQISEVLRHLRATIAHQGVGLHPIIVFEGPDGAGKTTYSRRFVEWLSHQVDRGRGIALMRNPSRVPNTIPGLMTRVVSESRAAGGQPINPEMEALVMLTARQGIIDEYNFYISQGADWVVSDRWKQSFIAHQLHGNGLVQSNPQFAEWLSRLDAPVTPMITVILTADDRVLDDRLSRIKTHSAHRMRHDYIIRSRDIYRALPAQLPGYRTDDADSMLGYCLDSRMIIVHQSEGETSDSVHRRVLHGFNSLAVELSRRLAATPTLEREVAERLQGKTWVHPPSDKQH